jgi:dihydrofolate synthase/folylpolyglutamate synthase
LSIPHEAGARGECHGAFDNRMRTLAEWLTLQESVHVRSIDLGLERVAVVARELGILGPSPLPYRIATVAGTNGKGSTVTYLEGLLRAAGLRAGALTSPHLTRYNERIQIQGVEVSDDELIGAFERIERARGTTTLTFFEYNTLAALLVFADRQVDVAVLEVGLGGRLDATNVVDCDVGVLCSIGFDHRDWLGDTLEAIGTEKAGIFRPGRPAVLGTSEMPDSVFRAIERIGAQPIVAGRDFTWDVGASGRWNYHGVRMTLVDLPPPALSGAIQFRNAATALAAYESLPHSPSLSLPRAAHALEAAQLRGRFQIFPGPVEWIVDVAHNEPAAQVLAENLHARRPAGRTWAVCSILRDKDVPAIARALADTVDEWILCTVREPRGSTAAELAERMSGDVANTQLADSVAGGCDIARSLTRSGDRVIVFGSFAAASAGLQWLEAARSGRRSVSEHA